MNLAERKAQKKQKLMAEIEQVDAEFRLQHL
jgi:hypothetical protein